MKNVCVVGYGAIGPIHAKALEGVKNAKLYAVCDVDAAARGRCLERYPVKEYEDFDRMLEDKNIDSVHICTPHYLHMEMTAKALDAGKDVVVEKPVAMTRQEFEKLKILKNAEKVCVVFQNRINPCMEKLKDIAESGKLGKVLGARGFVTWYRSKEYYASGAWRGKYATEGGGVLINQAVHTLDYFCYILGRPLRVRAHMCNDSLQGAIEVEDTVNARMEFADGVIGLFYATNGYFNNSTPMFEVSFEKGTVRYMDRTLWLNGEKAAEDVKPSVGRDYWGAGHGALLKRYYDSGKYFTVEDACDTMETMFAIYESAAEDGAVREP